jgi:hypothetical protein
MHLSRSTARYAVAFGTTFMMSLSVEAQQTKRWDHFCTIDNLRVCASLELTLTPSAGGTDVSIRAQNLQGIDGNVPWAMLFGFSGIQTTFASIAFRPFIQTLFLGTADIVVTDPLECSRLFFNCARSSVALAEWFFAGGTAGGPQPPPFDGSLVWTNQPGRPSWITGCDAPTTPAVAQTVAYYRTCGDGKVGFDFSVPADMRITDDTKAFVNVYTDEVQFGCVLGDADCLQATPEPATLALIATGFAAVGAYKRRRRKSSPES